MIGDLVLHRSGFWISPVSIRMFSIFAIIFLGMSGMVMTYVIGKSLLLGLSTKEWFLIELGDHRYIGILSFRIETKLLDTRNFRKMIGKVNRLIIII